MTSPTLPGAWLPLIDDLALELPDRERYQRLVGALRTWLPSDAVALLKLENEHLVPLAAEGLSDDVMGRRFRIDEHPRFATLLQSPSGMRFPPDSALPDPYDGLIDTPTQTLTVHDCMGCPIRLDQSNWGLITVDSLDSGRFTARDVQKLDTFVRLVAGVVKACERINALQRQLEDEHRLAKRYLEVAAQTESPVPIGQSAAYKSLLGEIEIVAGTDLTVLVAGESGVGKELVAQAIHARSNRVGRPMVSVNCAALPESLVESELFGHVRGAFSGAIGKRSGKFELADGGTLFLDEIGELPLSVQAKLLRVLQSGQLQRVGSDQEHHVDVRVIAATNRELSEEVRAGRFRADLYHRLSVYPLRVPPLRERGRDVLLLAGNFLEENRSRLRLRSLRLTTEAQAALVAYHWPGNVRELEHLVGRAALKARADANGNSVISIGTRHLDLPAIPMPPETAKLENGRPAPGLPLRDAVDRFQHSLIRSTLDRHEGNWAAAARTLGTDRANLRRLAVRLGIKA